MAKRMKWVEVNLKEVPNKNSIGIINGVNDVINLTNQIMNNVDYKAQLIINLSSSGNIINLDLVKSENFIKNQQSFLGKAILNNTASTILVSNNNQHIKEANDYLGLCTYFDIQAIDNFYFDYNQYVSQRADNVEFASSFDEISTINNNEIDYKFIKSKSNLKLNTLKYGKDISDFDSGINWIAETLSLSDREQLIVASFNKEYEMINAATVSVGSINESIANMRELFKVPLLSEASAIMVFHNHPSGSISPSDDDIATTNKIEVLSKMLNIEFIDHGIVRPYDKDIYYINSKGLLDKNKLKNKYRDCSILRENSNILNHETEYIDYENLSWDEYIKQFVSDNIEVLEGESISKEYFAEEFINCVEIPESDTMIFLDHFEPVVFDYLNGDNEKVDNFDFLKLNIIKNGVKDFAEVNLTAENGFIKVSNELVSDLKEKYLSNSKQKSNDIEMEL